MVEIFLNKPYFLQILWNIFNYFGKGTIRSAPFAIFTRQDLLRLALELNVPIPAIYGEIKTNDNGELYTTGEQRTGCSMCGFGIQLEILSVNHHVSYLLQY